MQMFRTIFLIIIGYYLFKVARRLFFVAKNDTTKTHREGSVTVDSKAHKPGKTPIDIGKASDIEDVDYVEVKE